MIGIGVTLIVLALGALWATLTGAPDAINAVVGLGAPGLLFFLGGLWAAR